MKSIPSKSAPKFAQPVRPRNGRQSAGLRQRAADLTRQNILKVATAEIAAKGLAGARVDEIANKTATSKHMIYYHFGSKEGLYRAVLEASYANFNQTESQIDFAQLEPVAALRALVGLNFDYLTRHPEYVRIVMSENINNGEHVKHVASVARRRDAVFEILGSIVSRGIAAGQFRSGLDVLQLHLTISALCFYYVSNRFTIGHIFKINLESPKVMKARRAFVIDALISICRRQQA
jgi:AcrR family transcriptional regulator